MINFKFLKGQNNVSPNTVQIINKIIYPNPTSVSSFRFVWATNDIFTYEYEEYRFYGSITNFINFYNTQRERLDQNDNWYLPLVPCILEIQGNNWMRRHYGDITLYSTVEDLAITYKIYHRNG